MTEFEINLSVAKKLGLDFKCSRSLEYVMVDLQIYDPCNNPSHAWGIIYENKIDLNFGDDVHSTLKNCVMASKGDKSVTREKPFVAAMLLFLGDLK